MVNRLSQPIPMGDLPRSIDEAVNRLISELPLRYAAKIAKMNGRDFERPSRHHRPVYQGELWTVERK